MEVLYRWLATAAIVALTCGVCRADANHGRSSERDCVIEHARLEIGVQEVGGNNRGKRVEDYLCSVNMAPGNPWCGAFVAYILYRCNVVHTVNAYSPTSTPRRNMIWSQKAAEQKAVPQPGDVFSLYYKNLGRIGHTGFVEEWGDTYVTTIEGNTNQEGSREGDGVWRKKRLKRTIYRVSRWVKD